MFRLILSEKPSVSASIAYCVGANEKVSDGKSFYWQGNGYIVTNALGHLFGIGMPEDYGYEKWELETLPLIPNEFKLLPLKGYGEQIKLLKKLLSRDDVSEVMTIIAIKANRPEVKLVLVLPCCKAEQTKYWGNTHIAFYDTILSCADDVIFISEYYYDKCYYDRNAKMVEMSSYCICYLKNEKSGTGQTVRMARKNGLEVVNIADGGLENV